MAQDEARLRQSDFKADTIGLAGREATLESGFIVEGKLKN